ncbi:hypothetical protein CHCC5027_3306 [Bacillus paralicheniformis]|uniref:hypothetical protein n=1 Tax=Bacillus paralicheniformis TaxID=1648923 RepID=UPI0011A43DC0|nr:hypothetical protein [Bacillus paralicheniformis]TWJ36215.1 hypothetical protein CHCC5027_3306 [Bacillus paralicheniformis]
MAEFKSRYKELGFYVNGILLTFKNGVFKTDDEDEIKVLSELADVTRIDKPTEEDAPKPAAKKQTRKSSAK